MTSFESLSPEVQARIEAATSWRQRLRQNPVLEISPEYLKWISYPKNAEALLSVEECLSALDAVASAPELLDMRQAALSHARNRLPKRRLSQSTIGAIAASVLITVCAGGGLYYYFSTSDSYATTMGERRTVALSDGSRISLDSDTRVRVRYTQNARDIELEHGRARFDVAHDVKRPFGVTAGSETVIAVGTSFDVERLGPKVLVTLIQGHVVVKDAVSPLGELFSAQQRQRPAVFLTAGQELVALPDLKPEVGSANIQLAVAWEAGKLVFRDESLTEAVERVNRYTDKPITVDPGVADIRINGVFNAGDIGAFVSGVTSYFPVQATTDANNNIVLQRRS